MTKSLDDMMQEVMDVNRTNGWFDDSRSFGDGIALLHSEVSEAFEAFREHGLKSFKVHTDGFMCERESNGQVCNAPGKPEGVGSEYADIFIRLLDSCARDGIDLLAEYERKLAYNRTRGYKHGGKAL